MNLLWEKTDISGTGVYTTTCMVCNMTCHDSCALSNDKDKYKCVAMENGDCTKCPGHCNWNKHSNVPWIFKTRMIKKKKTLEDLKKQYCAAKKGRVSQKQILKGVKNELCNTANDILKGMDVVKKSLEKLESIALKPNQFEVLDYINNMIESEKEQKNRGWEIRVDQLRNLRDKTENSRKIAKSEDIDFIELLPSFEDEINMLFKDSLSLSQVQLAQGQLAQGQLAQAQLAQGKQNKSTCCIF